MRVFFILASLSALFFAAINLLSYIRGDVPTSSTAYLTMFFLWAGFACSWADAATQYSNRDRD